MITTVIEFVLLLLLACLVAGSLLNLSSNPHWFIRGWDFPRVQIVAIAWLIVTAHSAVDHFAPNDILFSLWWYVLPTIGLTLWHGFRIVPYTTLYPKQAKPTHFRHRAVPRNDPATIRMIVSNVEQENDQYHQWRDVVRGLDADILIVLEPDQRWVDAATPLFGQFPYHVIHAQENWYGMMMLSRLPIEEHDIRFLVQDDVPSIDAKIRLDNEETIRVIAVHPRPPEPWRGNHATARDAELTLWGQELAGNPDPIIIGGDLNDVAWSATTRLFLRTSDLLDPRRGRGFFNTFHADHWYCRFPLDHIFHSHHFTVSKICRLAHIGSDHFPMMIDLRLDPARKDEHQVLDEKATDDSEVELRIERAERSETADVG